jgi:hypothetical protein
VIYVGTEKMFQKDSSQFLFESLYPKHFFMFGLNFINTPRENIDFGYGFRIKKSVISIHTTILPLTQNSINFERKIRQSSLEFRRLLFLMDGLQEFPFFISLGYDFDLVNYEGFYAQRVRTENFQRFWQAKQFETRVMRHGLVTKLSLQATQGILGFEFYGGLGLYFSDVKNPPERIPNSILQRDISWTEFQNRFYSVGIQLGARIMFMIPRKKIN